jgi:transposase
VVRTWAPVGETPVLRARLRRDHLSAISALTPGGQLYLQLQEKAHNNVTVAGFVRELLVEVPGKLLIIWDGGSIHQGPALNDLLSSPDGARLQIERLPGYAPELNPDELVWNQLKRVELRNVRCRNLKDLHEKVQGAAERIRQQPQILASFVQHACPV